MVGLVNVVGLLSRRLINESITLEWAQEQGVVRTGLAHFAPLSSRWAAGVLVALAPLAFNVLTQSLKPSSVLDLTRR